MCQGVLIGPSSGSTRGPLRSIWCGTTRAVSNTLQASKTGRFTRAKWPNLSISQRVAWLFLIEDKLITNGRSVMDISRELGINKQTFYNWKKKYAGMSGEHLRQLKQLQEENVRLKQMYADVSLDNKMLKDVLSKKW